MDSMVLVGISAEWFDEGFEKGLDVAMLDEGSDGPADLFAELGVGVLVSFVGCAVFLFRRVSG